MMLDTRLGSRSLMPPIFGLMVALGTVGCASNRSAQTSAEADRPTSPRTSDTGELAPGRFVVVPASAEFSSGTDATAERWSHESDELWTFEVVSVESQWVQLKEPTTEGRCYGTPPTLQHVDLDFYVRRKALRPVVTSEVNREYDDETSIRLEPGVALEKIETDRPTARLEGFSVPVEIDERAWGYAYDPAASNPSTPPEGEWFRAGGGIAIDGERFERRRSHPLRVVEKASAGETSETMFGHVASRCGEVRAVFNAPVGAEPPSDAAPDLDAKFQLTYASSGSPLYWPNGDRAGEVGREKWPLRVQTREHDGRRCFAASFVAPAPDAFTPERHFRICANPADLETPDEVERRKAENRVDETGGGHVSVLETAIQIRLRSLEGGHDWDAVKRPIAEQKGSIESCYRREVTPDDKFGGKLAVTVTIGRGGDVEKIERGSSTLDRDSVTQCVLGQLRESSFPRGSRASDLAVEFVFSLEDQ